MSKIEVNTVAPQCGTTLTLGESGDTVTLGSGASQSGFGRTGTVDWDTTPKTASFTAVSGNGYFINTTSSAITVTLPAGTANAIISLADYAATWQTNNVTVTPDGTDKIGGENEDAILNTKGQSVTFVFVDSTQGWINTMDSTSNVRGAGFIEATGGTETTCGDFKIHTFTGPGTFTVTAAGTPTGSNTVDYLVVAGGGSGGQNHGGGGGAGGYRESSGTASGCYAASPLGACVSALPVTSTGYPITVGGGGTSPGPGTGCAVGNSGSNSIFSTITSTGGGGGGSFGPPTGAMNGANGGSGGAGSGGGSGPSPLGGGVKGTGNTPPVSPSQGNQGGDGSASFQAGNGGGGGGATVAGGDSSGTTPSGGTSGTGGNGATSSINATPTTRAGGGSGGRWGPSGAVGAAGTGGGGTGGISPGSQVATVGTINTGGGGGGGADDVGFGAAGGSGIVIIRYKFQ